MSGMLTNVLHRAVAILERQKTVVVLAVVIALTSSGTAAAVTYVVLGGTNQSNLTTILRSNVNGAVLQVANNDTTGGASTKGINITVPAGRAPIWVNPTAGKATNLNADLLDGQNASAFLGVNQTAVNAEELDGMDYTEFLGANQTAANSDQLDGMDSTQFMTGPGKVVRGAIAYAPNDHGVVAALEGFWWIGYVCPDSVSNNGTYTVWNVTGETVDLFMDNGGTNPEYVQLPAELAVQRLAVATGEWIDIQIHSPSLGIAEISLFTVHRPATPDCHAQLMAVISGP